MQKVIALRKRRRDELTEFQKWIHGLAERLVTQLSELQDQRAIRLHLQAINEKEVLPRLKDLRKQLRELTRNLLPSAMSVRIKVPGLLTTVGVAGTIGAATLPHSASLLVGSVALGFVPFFRDKQNRATTAVHSSPATYLMYAEEDLTPRSVIARIRSGARRFMLGI